MIAPVLKRRLKARERGLLAAVETAVERQAYQRIGTELLRDDGRLRLPSDVTGHVKREAATLVATSSWHDIGAHLSRLRETKSLWRIYVRLDRSDLEILPVLSFAQGPVELETVEWELDWLWGGVRDLARVSPTSGFDAAAQHLAGALKALSPPAAELLRFAAAAGATARTVTAVALYCCCDGVTDELAAEAEYGLGRWRLGPGLSLNTDRIDAVVIDELTGAILGSTEGGSLDLEQLIHDLNYLRRG
jgi:hypothetical protein